MVAVQVASRVDSDSEVTFLEGGARCCEANYIDFFIRDETGAGFDIERGPSIGMEIFVLMEHFPRLFGVGNAEIGSTQTDCIRERNFPYPRIGGSIAAQKRGVDYFPHASQKFRRRAGKLRCLRIVIAATGDDQYCNESCPKQTHPIRWPQNSTSPVVVSGQFSGRVSTLTRKPARNSLVFLWEQTTMREIGQYIRAIFVR